MKRLKLFKAVTISFLALLLVSQEGYCSWKTLASMPTPGRWGAMTFAVDNKIFVSGGYVGNFQNKNDLLSYDPVTDKWNFKNGLPGNFIRTEGVTFVINGKAYLGLGAQDYNNFNPSPTYMADLWEYDPVADTWIAKSGFPSAGVSDAAVFVVNNKAYIVGGSEGSAKSAKTWEYDPAADKWKAKADYPGGGIRNGIGFAINSKGYIVGGEVAGTPTNKLYEYDPATDKWTAKKAYPEPSIWGGISLVIDNKAYIGLGADGAIGMSTIYSNHFFAYDQVADDWVYWQGAELTTSRMYSTVTVLNGKAYMGNGWKLDGSNQVFYNDWYAVDPQDILAVEKPATADEVRVYPNPVNNTLYIMSAHQYAAYKLYNVTGQLIMSGSVPADNKIGVHELSAGLYQLQLISRSNDRHYTLVSVQ
ncbi:MAG: T9SS type A sorting domain-containing protein [Chitinophagales bacterium]|nr:T9SS type A sorting domain-containing protein [Chitinophagales bacterium]